MGDDRAAPATLFDRLDVAALSQEAAPGAGLLAALLTRPEVTGTGGPSPDLVIVGGRWLPSAPTGWVAAPEGRALALAYGAAAARTGGPAPPAVWCLLRARALEDGRTWEAARAAAAVGVDALTAVLAVPAAGAADALAVLKAAGWRHWRASATDAWALTGGLDQTRAVRGPCALVAVCGDP